MANFTNFKVEISKIMMQYSRNYREWLENKNELTSLVTSVIEEFKISFILSLPKPGTSGEKEVK